MMRITIFLLVLALSSIRAEYKCPLKKEPPAVGVCDGNLICECGKPASIEYPEVVLAPGQTSGETIIKNAVKICSISVRSDGDGNPCKDEANYGIDYKDPRKIWTKNGCQGTFRVEMYEGKCTLAHTVTLNKQRPRWPLEGQRPADLCRFTFMESLGTNDKCTLDENFEFFPYHGEVRDDCEGDFKLCYIEKDNKDKDYVEPETHSKPAPKSAEKGSTSGNSLAAENRARYEKNTGKSDAVFNGKSRPGESE